MKYISSIIILILVLSFSTPLFASNYIWSVLDDETALTNASASDTVKENALSLQSGSAILIEQNSGKILYSHNIHEKLRPASVTKIMTILLIMEAIDSGKLSYSDKIPCTENAASMGGSQIWLDVREELTVDEMLKAICVVSANDCTVAMAEYLAGSQELFVEKMNIRAKELGMNDTTFKNCHGLDEDGHVTSANDIAIMSKELLNNHPDITKYTTIWMDTLRDGKSELVNTNKLVRNYSGATGLKTGSTSTALYNLSASATRNGLSLIAVIMKAPTSAIRFEEAKKLLDFGFSTFEYKEFGKKGDTVELLPVTKGIISSVYAICEENGGCLIEKGQEKNVVYEIDLNRNLTAPIFKGQKLGEIRYTLNGKIISSVNIIAQDNVDKVSVVNMITHVLSNWFCLLR